MAAARSWNILANRCLQLLASSLSDAVALQTFSCPLWFVVTRKTNLNLHLHPVNGTLAVSCPVRASPHLGGYYLSPEGGIQEVTNMTNVAGSIWLK